MPVLCELVWVLRRVYRVAVSDCARAIEALRSSASVSMDRQAARAGLRLLVAGGDFADGVIAFGGRALGSEQLATLDRDAARLLSDAGEPVLLQALQSLGRFANNVSVGTFAAECRARVTARIQIEQSPTCWFRH